MLPLEAIVWDLDGTLVDSAPDLAAALNTVLDMRGFAVLPLATVRTMIGNGVPKLVERGFNALGMRPDAEQLARLVSLFMREYSACATENTRPYPQVVNMLNQVRELNIPMGVCTNKPEAISRQILDELGLTVYFNSVIGGDTTPARKPDPLPLTTCLRELIAVPAASMMIGDSGVDVNTARAAGVFAGLVPWGYTLAPAEVLGADYILNDASELPDLISAAQRRHKQFAH